MAHAMHFIREKFRQSKHYALMKLLKHSDTDGDGTIDVDDFRDIFLMMNLH